MKSITTTLVGVVLLLLAGCADNTLSGLEDDRTYNVELRFSEEHVATLDHIEVEVFITDDAGNSVTSIPEVAVEYSPAGKDDWEAIQLEVHGDHYAAEYQFMNSGEFEFRVMGSLDEHRDHLDVMYTMAGHMEIERAHMEMDGMRISFETFPGHLHEGGEAEVRFWIAEEGGHSGGHGDGDTMMGGLAATITCVEADGSTETHTADEHETGVYEAHHTFLTSGDATLAVNFMRGGTMHEATFRVPVGDDH